MTMRGCWTLLLGVSVVLGACQTSSDDDVTDAATTAPPVPLLLIPSDLPSGVVGQPYEAGLEFRGGVPPYRFDVVDGEIPWGLRLDAAAGVLSGVPSSHGSYTFVVRVKDATGASATGSYDVTVDPWNPAQAVACGSSVTVSLTDRAVDDWGRYRFSSTSSAAFFALEVPPSGTTSLTLTATSEDGDPALFLGRSGEPPGSGREGYYYTFDTRPGPAEIRLHAASSPSLASYASGTYIALVLAATEPGQMTLTVDCGQGAVLTTDVLPNARAGQPYQTTLDVVSSAPPWRTVAASPLPSGLTLSEDGVLSGQIDTPGVYDFSISVSDASGLGETRTLTLWVPPVVSVSCEGEGEHDIDLAFDTGALGTSTGLATPGGVSFVEVTASDAVSRVEAVAERSDDGPYPAIYLGKPGVPAASSSLDDYVTARFGATDAPARLELDTSVLPLIADYAGTIPLAIGVAGEGGEGTLTLRCDDALDIRTLFLPNGTVGLAYDVQLDAVGGQGALTWTLASGAVDGLELGPDGLLSGTPAEPGRFSLSVSVQDAEGQSASRLFELGVGDVGAPDGCGDTAPVGCDTFVSGNLDASAWPGRLEANLTTPDAVAFFCVDIPSDSLSVEIDVSSTMGDMDLFAGYPGMAPGDRTVAHYWFVSAVAGDETLRIADATFPPLESYGGTVGIAVTAYEPGDYLVYVDCGE